MRRHQGEDFFIVNGDVFTGSSGSAVIDAKTGLVEGIVVQGRWTMSGIKSRGVGSLSCVLTMVVKERGLFP